MYETLFKPDVHGCVGQVALPAKAGWLSALPVETRLDACTQPQAAQLQFGNVGDTPVVGDWSGSGTSKIGVWRPGNATYYVDLNGNGYDLSDPAIPWGSSSETPVVGRWL